MISNDIKSIYYKSFSSKNTFIDLNTIVNRRLDKYLVEEKIISSDDLLKIWNKLFKLKTDKINLFEFNMNTIKKVSISWMNYYEIVPFDETSKTVKILIEDPLNVEKISLVERLFNKRCELYYGSKEDIIQIINILENDNIKNTKNIETSKVNKLIDSIINQANKYKSSDVHFDVDSNNVSVRFRIDGVLKLLSSINLDTYQILLNRIKILSKIDVTRTNLPQDGQMNYKKQEIRVSTFPTLRGERLTLRFYNSYDGLYEIESLGFDDQQLSDIKSSLSGNGIIFITGPTGSGKTTTIYSLINELKKQNKNIITVEDPVEKEISGVCQVPLNNLDYTEILKNIIRQDPDVIMIGEIRDIETLTLAVRLAQTGHLVVTTIHTNDAIGVFNRLINMGIPKYLILDTVRLIISQRLIRKPCSNCQEILNEDDNEVLTTKGCNKCMHTGYNGRLLLSEVLLIDHKVKSLLLEKNYRSLILRYKKNAFIKFKAKKMLKEKIITFEELNRNGLI